MNKQINTLALLLLLVVLWPLTSQALSPVEYELCLIEGEVEKATYNPEWEDFDEELGIGTDLSFPERYTLEVLVSKVESAEEYDSERQKPDFGSYSCETLYTEGETDHFYIAVSDVDRPGKLIQGAKIRGEARNPFGRAYFVDYEVEQSEDQKDGGLEDIIKQLLERIAELEAKLDERDQTPTPAPTPAPTESLTPIPSVLDTNLAPGSSGERVRELQRWLNENDFQVAATGAGSPGNETTHYGARTREVVGKLQDHLGVNYGNFRGYWGPSTRAAVADR